MDEIEDAVLGMAEAYQHPHGHSKAEDEMFKVDRHTESLSFNLGGSGTITLRRDPALKAVTLDTTSGTFNFFFNPITHEWKEPHTGHELRGLLTRDLSALRKGMPTF